MSRATILTVDDDPMVSRGDHPRPAPRYGADYRVVRASSGAEALEVLDEARAARPAGRPGRRRPADAADDRHRAARARSRSTPPDAKLLLLTAYADTDVAIARDQRDRPRPLPAQAVGPARGAALPRPRRPARRLAPRAPRAHLRRCASSATAGPSAATRSRRSSRATTCPTGGSTSSATRRARGWPPSPARRPATCRSCSSPRASRCGRRRSLDLAAALGLRTTARAAALRRLHRRRRPGRSGRGGVRRVRGPEHRGRRAEAPGGQAGQSAAIENYLGFPAGPDRRRPRAPRLAQAPRFGAEMVLARDVVGARVARTGQRRALRRAATRSRPGR